MTLRRHTHLPRNRVDQRRGLAGIDIDLDVEHRDDAGAEELDGLHLTPEGVVVDLLEVPCVQDVRAGLSGHEKVDEVPMLDWQRHRSR